MVKFQTWLWGFYLAVGLASYPYLRSAYFPQFPTVFERLISGVLALAWIVSVPITFILKQDDAQDNVAFGVSYDGFVGREQ